VHKKKHPTGIGKTNITDGAIWMIPGKWFGGCINAVTINDRKTGQISSKL
jgi:hypothetical protein